MTRHLISAKSRQPRGLDRCATLLAREVKQVHRWLATLGCFENELAG
jgi:hypothetical protein